MFSPLPLPLVPTSPPHSPSPSILLHPPFLLNPSLLLLDLPILRLLLHPPAPPSASPVHPSPSLPFLDKSLISNLGLLAGCRAPLAAARSSWNPEGASCSGIGARGPCHLDLRPMCSRHPPQSSSLEILVEGEGAAQAHLSDTPCWMWASPLKMVRR